MTSDAIKHECFDKAILKLVANLWQEMAKLVEAICQAQGALPQSHEKQKDKSAHPVDTEIRQARQDIQRELHQKEEKTKLDQELGYGQQQVLKGFKVEADAKNAEQQEHIARLQVDIGLMRSEIDTQKIEFEKAILVEDGVAKICNELEGKLATEVS